jgi:RNA polymerase sigma-70 factor (ECF subfamily)
MAAPVRRLWGAAEAPALYAVDKSDAELLSRIVEGDSPAFELLYRRYARAMFALALRQLRDRGRAEDVVQEVFVALWRSAASYRPERGRVAPWLYAIARHAIVDSVRSSVVRSRSGLVGAVPETASAEPTPEESLESDQIAFAVHAAVAQLPERERVPLELAYWKGRSQSEIANLLGLPIGTVKTRMRSGLARMAKHLEGTT